jgi:hypothetical protein
MKEHITKTEAILRICEQYGDFHIPKFYRVKAKELYDLDIQAPLVSKTIGKFNDRINCSLVVIKAQARRLLEASNNDVGLCVKIIRRVGKNVC